MKRFIFVGIFSLFNISFAFSQGSVLPGYTTNGSNFIKVSPTTPLPITGTFTPPALQNVNVTQLGSVAINLGAGATATGTIRTTQASDSPLITTLGAQTDAVCATATGTCSTQALLKYLNSQIISAVPAGTNIIGKVGIDQTTPGTTNLVSAGQNGTWNITNVSGTISLPTGASTAANQTSIIGTKAAGTAATNSMLGGGVYNSAGVAPTDGQQVALQVDAFGQLKVGPDGAPVSGSVSSAATLFSTDMLGYESISVQVTSAGTSSTITYETSDDNTNWVSTVGTVSTLVPGATTNTNNFGSTSTTAIQNSFPRRGRYFRARVSTYGSGTVTVVGTLNKSPFFFIPIVSLLGLLPAPHLSSMTNRSIALTTGGTSQQIAAANNARKRIIIMNPCTLTSQGIAVAENIFVNFTTAASATAGNSFELQPCGSYDSGQGPVTTEAVNVVAATTGHLIVSKEQ